jgi:hypothetical protein
MSTAIKPIVYVGPTLPPGEASRSLPGCRVRPPIRRGELYRDREEGGQLFVLIDGVMHQDPGVAPREIRDVIADGAVIVGASSLGALRAAECWPLGMVGVGSIYRLYRRGRLDSDDEVLLSFSADEDFRNLSTPLINIRYALSRAVRAGLLHSGDARCILDAARRRHFSERRWPEILDDAVGGRYGGALLEALRGFDLKKLDAQRCLKRVKGWLDSASPTITPVSRRSGVFTPADEHRERQHDALSGLAVDAVKREVARWQLISGRYARHILAIANVIEDPRFAESISTKDDLSPLLREIMHVDGRFRSSAEVESRTRAFTLRLALTKLWKIAGTDLTRFAEALWAELAASDELDAEVFRWRAVSQAVEEARRRGLSAQPRYVYSAAAEIAHAHGFGSWGEMQEAADLAPFPWPEFVAYRDDLALAKRLRGELFTATRA